MARAKAMTWAGIVLGTVLAPAGATAAPSAADLYTTLAAPALGQQLWGKTKAHSAMNQGIEFHRGGEYEMAGKQFDQAQERSHELSDEERAELTTWMQLNVTAAKARRDGTDQLRKAEQAAKAGRTQEAAGLLRQVTANQYLAATDKVKAQKLVQELRPSAPVATAQAGGDNATKLSLARAKVQQARAMMAKGNYDAAQQLALEADRLGAVWDEKDDMPHMVLGDIHKVRANPKAVSAAPKVGTDPKAMLAEARAAYQRGDLAQAEMLAQAAQQGESWSMWRLGDSPAKVLKDVQAARGKSAVTAAPTAKVPATDAKPERSSPYGMVPVKSVFTKKSGEDAAAKVEPSTKPPVAKAEAPAKPSTVKAEIPAKPTTVVSAKPPETLKPGATDNPGKAPSQDTDAARKLVKQARMALQEGNAEQAKKLCAQASAMKPNLNWWDDTPEKVLGDIQRMETKGTAVAKKGTASEAPKAITAVKAPEVKTDDARAMLKQGRELYAAGKLEDAAQTAQKAKIASTKWGLFEDSPDKLQTDINKARTKRDQEESVRLLADARQMMGEGNYDDAAKAAYKAQRLHGPYSVWDLGDRPQKVLAEVETHKAKMKKDGNATAVAKATPPAPKDNGQRTPKDIQLASGTTPSGDIAKRQQAQQLVADARQLQAAGRMIDARRKISEAQKLGVLFGPDEPSPDRALIDLMSASNKRIQNLVQEADGHVALAGTDPARFQKAEESLAQAYELALGFGLDAQVIDRKLTAVRQLRLTVQAVAPGMQAPPSVPGSVQVAKGPDLPPPAPVTPPAPANPFMPPSSPPAPVNPPLPLSPPAPVGPATNPGLAMLEQARLELRSGQTTTARRLAEEAFKSPHGVQAQAADLLRSIDVEEFNQGRLAANRTFDAGLGALNRRDYSQAALILRTLDPHLLDADKQARLKELMALPELQPSATVAASGAKAPATEQGTDVVQAAAPGIAKATDNVTPEQDFAKQVLAMQEVKFQQLRQEGIRVQQEATERFQAGDTDRALEILQEYSATLRESQVDPDRVALLRRPVENRLQQFKQLKAQKDFEKLQAGKLDTVETSRSRLALATENKQRRVAELMKQYNSFFKQAKYPEAEKYAMLAHELDPDNHVTGAAVFTARTMRRQVEYQGVKDRKESVVAGGLNESEDTGPFVSPNDPLKINPEYTERARKRSEDFGRGIALLHENGKAREIQHRLNTPVNLEFKDTPLKQVIDDLRTINGINIIPDEPALLEEGISLDRPVSIKLEGITLKSALNLLLHQVHLTWTPKDEVILITTERYAHGRQIQKVYQVADLIIPVDNFTLPASSNLAHLLDQQTRPISNMTNNGPSPYTGQNALQTGTAVSQFGSSGNGTSMSTPTGLAASGNANSAVKERQPGETMQDMLIKLITNTISPNSWSNLGGGGTIDYFPLGMALVVSQTPDIQEQIADLLAALRRLQDQQVTVEVRFITIAESFYERIGLDFNVNIKTDHQTRKYEPMLTTGQFKPLGQINDFSPDRFISGLTPAGGAGGGGSPASFTSDLDIPIINSSFARAIPPFGAFPNSPGSNGGLSLGLAFLSDIQVFLFLEAAQGDQRTNVMQAPKLTMFNGQTSTLTVTDTQFFVTNVTVIQVNGQVAFVPFNTPLPTGGVTLTMNAVVSSDRRYVRMSLTPALTNLTSANIPLFPIVTPIFPIFEGGFQAPPILFTQFIQQPVINTITVSTTVNVPDGGTVLMGGLKRLSEGRNEFGPPVLSKLPYINRLFKNVGYGREATSLLMMVTPRIIINEEEETRQTGVVTTPVSTNF